MPTVAQEIPTGTSYLNILIDSRKYIPRIIRGIGDLNNLVSKRVKKCSNDSINTYIFIQKLTLKIANSCNQMFSLAHK